MLEIATGKVVCLAAKRAMMDLLKRDYANESKDADDQGRGFTGIAWLEFKAPDFGQRLDGPALPARCGVHRTAGRKQVRAGYFTTDHANEREIIPTVARVVISGLKDGGSMKNDRSFRSMRVGADSVPPLVVLFGSAVPGSNWGFT